MYPRSLKFAVSDFFAPDGAGSGGVAPINLFWRRRRAPPDKMPINLKIRLMK